MAIQDISYLDHEVGIHVFGEPSDVEYFIGRTDAAGVMIAGYDVKNMGDAQHDGHEAIRFTLTADNREVGRLVIMTTATEYTFEFDVLFDDELKRDAWVESFRNPPATPKVVESIQDFSYVGDLYEEIAKMSAKHGVSIAVIDPSGPGGGWPVVKVTGLVENVRAALMAEDYGWGYSEHEVDDVDMMQAVTV